jgi:hypothetical protein
VKSYTTRFLKSVALAYMGFPLVYLLTAAVLFDMPGSACLRVLLSPSYYVISALAALAGYGLWEMKRWSWHLFLLVNLLVTYNNAVLVSDHGETHHKLMAFLASAAILVFLVLRVSREVRVPYFLPRIRWWESNPRYKLSVPVQMVRIDGSRLPGDIMDLSLGGCFIKLRNELAQDEPLALEFTVFALPITARGTVVWRTTSTVTHPKGVGVKFGQVTRQQRRELRAVVQRLRKIAAYYRSARFLTSQDEFMKRLHELQSEPVVVERRRLRA